MSRTPRQVRAIDRDAAQPMVAAVYKALYGEPFKGHVDVQALVVGWNEDDKMIDLAAVCTEGVGHWVRSDNTLGIWCDGGMYSVPLGINMIPVADEPIDLAAHVRTFGARLESNWYLWERAAGMVTEPVRAYLTRFTVDGDAR
jgi:hypothetical protein